MKTNRPVNIRELFYIPPIEPAHTYASENADVYRAYDKGQADYAFRVESQTIEEVKEIEFMEAISGVHSGDAKEARMIYKKVNELFWLLKRREE